MAKQRKEPVRFLQDDEEAYSSNPAKFLIYLKLGEVARLTMVISTEFSFFYEELKVLIDFFGSCRWDYQKPNILLSNYTYY
jgi:hypothetical protein